MEAEELRKYALTLSEKERAELASGLIDSLDLIVDSDAQVAWQEEIARRLEQGETSQVETNPWDEIRYLSRCPSYILRQFPVRHPLLRCDDEVFVLRAVEARLLEKAVESVTPSFRQLGP